MTVQKQYDRMIEMEDNVAADKYPLEEFNSIGKERVRRLDGLEKASGRAEYTMDVQLPGMSGVEATQRIKADARLAHIPVIALTARAMKGDREDFLAQGFDDYVAKPVDPEAPRDAVRRWSVQGEAGA